MQGLKKILALLAMVVVMGAYSSAGFAAEQKAAGSKKEHKCNCDHGKAGAKAKKGGEKEKKAQACSAGEEGCGQHGGEGHEGHAH